LRRRKPHTARSAFLVMAAFAATGAAIHAPQAKAQAAVAQPAARSYAIPAGSLAQTLSAFAKEAAVTVSFRPEDTAGMDSQGLQGNYTVADASN
jgi:Fe(3+) dicitrate transport protein